MATFFCILIFLLLPAFFSPSLEKSSSSVQIVYMGEKKHKDPDMVRDSHLEMLVALLGSKEAARDSFVYSYSHGFSGFAAKLTESQAKKIAEFPGVVHVTPNQMHQLHTTRSWDFLGVYPPSTGNLLSESKQGDGVIIGVVDTGIWPESESFKDDGMGPIPTRWRGICQEGVGFNVSNCNKKLIGARWFAEGAKAENPQIFADEVESPRDVYGHGTHTASTAAGSLMRNASFMGVATGVAKGGAPLAHIAVYKACWENHGCSLADILAAFDYAIHDGVDVLSLSLGSNPPLSSYMDGGSWAMGAFHATANGITVVCSAGNGGPITQTVANAAPWMLTVGASTIDRSFPTAITLGNNISYMGQALYRGRNTKFYQLVYAGSIRNNFSASTSRSCSPGTLNSTLARGKVVLCFWGVSQQHVRTADATVKEAGAVGVIFAQPPRNNLASCGPSPCIIVNYDVGTKINLYIQRTRNPTVQLSSSTTTLGNLVSPTISYFSSRGPSSLSPGILKPDIAAPGSNILAAWSPMGSLYTSENYVIISGTSMACPHVSGIVALLKSVHPKWSPAAIKSALVTTASTTDVYGQRIEAESGVRKLADPFDYGGGHVNANAASNPGLVYDMNTADNALFLCSMGYRSHDISLVTNMSISCPQESSFIMLNLNLPSISIPNLKTRVTLSRTVTNVGAINAVYVAKVEAPTDVSIDVSPKTLSFNATARMLSFQVQFTAAQQKQGFYTFGSLTWSDGAHNVRIPIAVRTILYDNYEDAS